MKIFIIGLLMFLAPLCLIDVSYADNAEVLPKGITRLRLTNEYTLPVDDKYDPDGKIEKTGADYSTDLNVGVFPALIAFGTSSTIGVSTVSLEYTYNVTEFAFERGITDKLTVGVLIPYWKVKNDVSAVVDASSATVGKNSTVNNLWPIGAGPGVTVPLTTDDVQDLLGPGLDVTGDGSIEVAGFGYDRIENWSGSGIGDIKAGFRYQYLKTEDWRLAVTSALRLPTGEIDDKDNLVDFHPYTTGAYAVLLHLNNDYTAVDKVLLNCTLRYDLILPTNEILRVPADPNLPITTNEEKVNRDIGDVFEFELSGQYELSKTFNVSLLYNYKAKPQDEVSGSQGLPYEALERETDATSHVYIVGLTYSTVSRYMEKSFPVPLTASVAYRDRFAGSNNAMNSQYVKLGLQVYF